MAKFNEILAGRYNRYLQKLFQLKGGPPSAQLASEVMPTFAFFTGVENRFLESYDRFGTAQTVAAAAGFVSAVRLRNPASSAVIAVIENCWIGVGAAGQLNIFLNPQTTDFASGMPSTRLDPRGRSNTGLLLTSQNTTAAIAGTGNQIFAPNFFAIAAVSVPLINCEEQEIPILPGDALTFVTNNQNVLLNISLIWRERALEDSELK